MSDALLRTLLKRPGALRAQTTQTPSMLDTLYNPPALGPRPRDGWSPTQLAPEEEERFQHDMRNAAGYKDWRAAWESDYGEAPDYDDPEGDYDYRGAWKAGVVPALYKHDGKYHWGSSTEDGTMLKAPDHPTAWMEHFMRETGRDPNDVGVKNEEDGQEWAKTHRSEFAPTPYNGLLNAIRTNAARAR